MCLPAVSLTEEFQRMDNVMHIAILKTIKNNYWKP